MAKKIKIDFTKTEERSGWNSKHMPEGLHEAKIASVQQTEAGDGTAMLVYALVPTNPRYKTRNFPYYCKLQQNQFWKLRDLMVSAGETVPKKVLQIDPEKIVGRLVAVEIEDDNYQGNLRSQVNAVYGTDIIGDDEGHSEDEEFDEDAEDEEFEDDEVDDEDDSDEEEFEEDDDEDYDDEDEDDLDDEDLEDEDDDFEDEDEDEEEEPEPAPKKRAAKKAPAKAAPAKKAAAPKATAKRTVKRR